MTIGEEIIRILKQDILQDDDFEGYRPAHIRCLGFDGTDQARGSDRDSV